MTSSVGAIPVARPFAAVRTAADATDGGVGVEGVCWVEHSERGIRRGEREAARVMQVQVEARDLWPALLDGLQLVLDHPRPVPAHRITQCHRGHLDSDLVPHRVLAREQLHTLLLGELAYEVRAPGGVHADACLRRTGFLRSRHDRRPPLDLLVLRAVGVPADKHVAEVTGERWCAPPAHGQRGTVLAGALHASLVQCQRGIGHALARAEATDDFIDVRHLWRVPRAHERAHGDA